MFLLAIPLPAPNPQVAADWAAGTYFPCGESPGVPDRVKFSDCD